MTDHTSRSQYYPPLLALLFCLLFIDVYPASGQEQEPAVDTAAVSGRDLSADFWLPEGLEAALWAESPMLYNPTNMDVDARGRIWVVEAVNYRDFNNPPDERRNHPEGERIVILEDTDDDGVADSSKVFVQDEDLVSPLGIAVLDDRVVVSSAPSIVVYTDANGDDKPETKDVFLTGFGGFDHDHSVHAVTAGPGGRWYFNTGNAGPHIVTDSSGWTLRAGSMYTGGTPYHTYNEGDLVSDDGHVYVGGVALRIGGDGRGLEVLSHNYRNPYELAVDSYGRLWTTDNDDQVVTCRTMWVMARSNAGYFSADGTRRWQADRRPGQDAFTAHWHQEDPGVIPAGDNTGAGSPTGITVYEDDALGPQYRGMVLSVDAGRNVVFGYPNPERDGAGYRLDRSTFVSSLSPSDLEESIENYVWNDTPQDRRKWFRPSDIVVGTDGAVYIADWYDPVVGGHQMDDAKGYGRIYRITLEGEKLSSPPIDLSTTEGQIRALLSPATNVRYAGFTRLKARGSAAVDSVKKILASDNPFHRARAAWLLAHLGPEGVEEVEQLLHDENPEIRAAAFRALQQVEDDVLVYARQLSDDSSPAVRREVALALEDVSLDRSADIVMQLVEGFEADDRWYVEALGTALEGKEEEVYPMLMERFGDSDPLEWSRAFARLTWRLHPAAAVDALQKRARADALTDTLRREAMTALGFIDDRRAVAAVLELSRSDVPEVAERASWWLDYRKNNEWRDLWDWPEDSTGAAAAAWEQMLELRETVVHGDSSMDRRIEAVSTMAGDGKGGRLLVDLIAEGGLPQPVQDAVRREIMSNPLEVVRVLAAHLLDRPDSVDPVSVDEVLDRQGDERRGRKLFYASCASCHRAGPVGRHVGPDLTHVRQKLDRRGITRAIVDPSETIAHGYEALQLTRTDGRVLFGFLLADGETVVLKDAAGRRRAVSGDQVARRKRLEMSLMPDPRELQLTAQDVADLRQFLMNVDSR